MEHNRNFDENIVIILMQISNEKLQENDQSFYKLNCDYVLKKNYSLYIMSCEKFISVDALIDLNKKQNFLGSSKQAR